MAHLHLLLRAEVRTALGTPRRACRFLRQAVALAGMRVLKGPHAVLSVVPGNEGVSAHVILDYSSANIHEWPYQYGEPVIQFDLYTCGATAPTVGLFLPLLGTLGLRSVRARLVDRDGMPIAGVS